MRLEFAQDVDVLGAEQRWRGETPGAELDLPAGVTAQVPRFLGYARNENGVGCLAGDGLVGGRYVLGSSATLGTTKAKGIWPDERLVGGRTVLGSSASLALRSERQFGREQTAPYDSPRG